MNNAAELWRQYHAANSSGNTALAARILKSLHKYKGNPPPRPGGCAKCRRSFY